VLTGLKRKLRDGTVDLQLRPPLDTLVVRWKPSCTLSTLLKSAAQGSPTSCLNFDFAILNLFEPSAL
jgi:hypothetical protein